MECTLNHTSVTIESQKKEIILREWRCVLDTMEIEAPWEYEKWGFLLYAHSAWEGLIFQFQIEWYTCWYMAHSFENITPDMLDFFGDLDILFASWVQEVKAILEKIDPRLFVLFASSPKDMDTVFPDIPWVTKWKVRDADFSPDKTNCILLRSEKSQ